MNFDLNSFIYVQLMGFKKLLVRYKNMDDYFDQLYAAGLEPTKKETNKFARLQDEYLSYKLFFKTWDLRLENYYLSDIANLMEKKFLHI